MIQKSHNLKIAKTLALATVLGLSLANGANAAEALSVDLQAKSSLIVLFIQTATKAIMLLIPVF